MFQEINGPEDFFNEIYNGKKLDTKVIDVCGQMKIDPSLIMPKYLKIAFKSLIDERKNSWTREPTSALPTPVSTTSTKGGIKPWLLSRCVSMRTIS